LRTCPAKEDCSGVFNQHWRAAMDMEDRVTDETNIGDILKKCPESESVFMRHFGEDCFASPGTKLETISFGAAMHGLEPGPIVKELNRLLDIRMSGRKR
jgi:hypothetical protein